MAAKQTNAIGQWFQLALHFMQVLDRIIPFIFFPLTFLIRKEPGNGRPLAYKVAILI